MGGCVFKVLKQRKQAHTQWVLVFFTFLLSVCTADRAHLNLPVRSESIQALTLSLETSFTIINLYENYNIQIIC